MATPETTVERIAFYLDTLSGNLPKDDADPDFARWTHENAFALEQLRKNLDESMSYADRAMIAPKLRSFNLRLKEAIARYGTESETKVELRRLQQFVESRTPGIVGEYAVEGAGAAASGVGMATDAAMSAPSDAWALGQHEVEIWKRSDWSTRISRIGIGATIGLGTLFFLKKMYDWTTDKNRGFFGKLFGWLGMGAIAIGTIKMLDTVIKPREQLAKLDPASYGHYAPHPPAAEKPKEGPAPPKPPASKPGTVDF